MPVPPSLAPQPGRILHDPVRLRQRLTAPLGRLEAFALFLALGLAALFAYLQYTGAYLPFDYTNYILGAQGDTQRYYYAYWLLPVLRLFAWLPPPGGYFLWAAFNALGVWFAARVFGGRPALALLTYQLFYVLFYGQITGLIAGGLALFWLALAGGGWLLAGVGLALAAVKFQLGLPLGLWLWLFAPAPWRTKFKSLLVPLLVLLFSLLLYPGWPLQTLHTLQVSPPDARGSISLWQWVGPAAVLLFLPPLLLRLDHRRRLLLLVAATCLALPYFQQTDLLALFAFPIGPLALLGNLGFLFIVYDWAVLPLLAVVPALVYAVLLAQAWRARRG